MTVTASVPRHLSAFSTRDRVVRPQRTPTEEERQILNLGAITDVHNSPRQVFLARVRADYAQHLMKVTSRVAEAPYHQEPRRIPLPQRMRTVLARALRQVYVTGREHVRQEVARQKASPPKRELREELTFLERLSELIRDVFDDLQLSVLGEMVKRGRRAKLIGMAQSDIRELLATLADDRLDRDVLRLIDNSLPIAYVQGRLAQAQIVESDIKEEVYTAIMDANTCGPCRARDGHRGPIDSHSIPNPECEGGGLCRCFTYYVLKKERAATRQTPTARLRRQAIRPGVQTREPVES
jgi:hypothetical protein